MKWMSELLRLMMAYLEESDDKGERVDRQYKSRCDGCSKYRVMKQKVEGIVVGPQNGCKARYYVCGCPELEKKNKDTIFHEVMHYVSYYAVSKKKTRKLLSPSFHKQINSKVTMEGNNS